jgi:hypothetical protein
MDATAMTFPDETFDVVIDKGTLDAIMVLSNDFFIFSAGKYLNLPRSY